MPPLSETIRKDSPPGYADMGLSLTIPPPISLPGQGTFRNTPHIRTPLPPMNAVVDVLRQFKEGNTSSPRRRVIPLPSNTGVGSSITNVTNTTVVTSGSGGGSTTPKLTAQTVVVTTPILGAAGINTQTVTMAKSFQLIAAVVTLPCEIRLYGSPGAQSNDSSRATDAPVPAEVFNGLITDVVFEAPVLTWTWQNRLGANADNPQDTHAFITVVNTSGSSAQIQVTLLFLPLES